MDQDRRAFLHDTGRFIFLTGAATLAWDFVVAGARSRHRTTSPPITGGG